MKTTTLFAVAFLALSTVIQAFAQPGSICHWDHDKKAAVVLTFDDWSPGQFPIVVPELHERGLTCTFFIMLSSVTPENHPWSDVVTAASYGNEIGNHTQTHPSLTGIPAGQLSAEIREMKDSIDSNVPSQTVVSFAYPMGSYNNQIIDSLKASGHITARSTMPSSNNYSYRIGSTNNAYFVILTYPMDGAKKTSEFFQQIRNVMKGGGLLTYLYHSIDDAGGTYHDDWYARVTRDSLRKQLDTLMSVQDQVWITTLGKAIRYHREAGCATLREISPFDGEQWILGLTDTLSNDDLFDQPLTIKLKLNGITCSAISQGGQPLEIDSLFQDTVMFQAIPDRGEITVEGSGPTGFDHGARKGCQDLPFTRIHVRYHRIRCADERTGDCDL